MNKYRNIVATEIMSEKNMGWVLFICELNWLIPFTKHKSIKWCSCSMLILITLSMSLRRTYEALASCDINLNTNTTHQKITRK